MADDSMDFSAPVDQSGGAPVSLMDNSGGAGGGNAPLTLNDAGGAYGGGAVAPLTLNDAGGAYGGGAVAPLTLNDAGGAYGGGNGDFGAAMPPLTPVSLPSGDGGYGGGNGDFGAAMPPLTPVSLPSGDGGYGGGAGNQPNMWGAVGQTPPPTGPAGQGLLQDMARRTAADMGTPNAFGLMPGQAVMGGGNNTNPNADPYNSNYNPNGNNGVAQGTDAYNQNLQDARSRAMNDRAQAVGAQNRVPTSLLSQNPYGPQFQAQTQGILQDARARQYNTAVEDLRQMYAQMGRPLDPRMIATLRMQQARDQNADLTNLQTQTAGAGFQATAQYVSAMQQNANSLNNVLGNTNYLPGTQDLALLLSMAKAGGQNGGQRASGGGAGAPSPSGQGDMPALPPAPAGNWAGDDAATAFYNTGDGGMQESPEEQMS